MSIGPSYATYHLFSAKHPLTQSISDGSIMAKMPLILHQWLVPT